MTAEPVQPALPHPSAGGPAIQAHVGCCSCGYDLIGLGANIMCPECGTPVSESVRGILFQFPSRLDVIRLRKGLDWILKGLNFSIAVVFACWPTVGYFGGWLGLAIAQAIMLLWGIWIDAGYLKFVAPTPLVDSEDDPTMLRRLVRIAVTIHNGSAVARLWLAIAALLANSPRVEHAVGMVVWTTVVVSFSAWIVRFVATVLYVRWIGHRIPDVFLARLTRIHLWLIPLLSVAGTAVVGLGPLFALMLYWNMLDRLRAHLKSIEQTGSPASMPDRL